MSWTCPNCGKAVPEGAPHTACSFSTYLPEPDKPIDPNTGNLPFCFAHNRWPCGDCGTAHFVGCKCSFCIPSWHTEELPDFTAHGFHTGRKVRFKLSDGREIEDVYQGWGVFGTGKGFDWMVGEPHVVAWQAGESA